MVRETLARFNRDSPGVDFVADEVEEANGHVVVVGRLQAWRDGHLSRELPMALLWKFEDDDLACINQFASRQAALDAVRFRSDSSQPKGGSPD
jgi:hypothetical protein